MAPVLTYKHKYALCMIVVARVAGHIVTFLAHVLAQDF